MWRPELPEMKAEVVVVALLWFRAKVRQTFPRAKLQRHTFLVLHLDFVGLSPVDVFLVSPGFLCNLVRTQVGMNGDTFSIKAPKNVLRSLLPLLKGNSVPEEMFLEYSFCS